ncbi:TPA: hypothetical protein RFV54_001055 [Klebsiella aerogenes]|nr:hypothetical protein [Klebsiella aerogenes]
MAKKWNEVLANPDYQKLSVSEKSAAREQYFNEVVAPQIGSNEHGAAYQQFTQENPVVTGQAANMGNIRDSSGKGFKSYDTPEAGAYDQMRLLTDYSNKHGLNTVSAIAKRWAPSNENDTQNYTNNIASISGLDPSKPLDLSDPNVLGALSYAQARMEKGANNVPFTKEQYIAMAGKRGYYGTAPQSAPEAPQQPQTPEATQPQGQEPTTPPEAAQSATSDPYAQMKNAYGQQRQEIEVPSYAKDSKAFALSVFGTRDKADWQHPLGFISPYETINDVSPTTVEHAEQTQQMGRSVLKGGAYAAAYEATAGLAAPFMEAVGLSPALAGVTARAAGNTAGSVSSQSTDAIGNDQWAGVDLGEVGQDVIGGELLHRGGEFLKPGNAGRRAAMTEARIADAAREQRIGEVSDSITEINRLSPELRGKTPEQILNNKDLVDQFRKPGETQVVPERLQDAFNGMYGNSYGKIISESLENGSHPSTHPDWQPALDAAYKTPASDLRVNQATDTLKAEFVKSEKTRPQYTIEELENANKAYQSGSSVNPNIPIVGNIFNPAMRMGTLSDSMLDRLGVKGSERFALRMGEGGEGSMFGAGQMTRKANQNALGRYAYKAENEAKTMAGRKGTGSKLSQRDLEDMQYQHDQLSESLKPQIEAYDHAIQKQTELTERLKGDLSFDEYTATIQELHNVSAEVKNLWPQYRDSKTIIQNSEQQLGKQVQKVKDAIKSSNAYSKAAKEGKDYRSTRDLGNNEAGMLTEAESLTRGGKTKGYDETQYTVQQTPRKLMENKEAARKAANQQDAFFTTPEHKLTSWYHFVSHGKTLIPHLMAFGSSRNIAQSIVRDLERTGGKNLTGDQLRKVMAFMIDNPATIGYMNSGDSSSDERNTKAEKQKLIQEEESYQRMIRQQQ